MSQRVAYKDSLPMLKLKFGRMAVNAVPETSGRTRRSSLKPLWGGLMTVFALVVSAPSLANPDIVVIDRLTQAGNAAFLPDFGVDVPQVVASDAATIVGTHRKQFIEFDAATTDGDVSNQVVGNSGQWRHNNATDQTSQATIRWDGTDDASVDAFSLGLDLQTGATACTNAGLEGGISLVARRSANVTDIDFAFYSSATNYSVVSFSVPLNADPNFPINTPELVEIPIDQLDTAGIIGDLEVEVFGSGVDIGNIQAIEIRSVPRDVAVNFTLASPIIFSCGTDFGDAPDASIEFPEGSGLNPFSYPVILGSGSTAAGGIHYIGGPFLGLGLNDTDSEEDGQPSIGADGDDLAGINDEQALVDGFQRRRVTIGPDPDTVPMSCDGVSMATTSQYCVAVQVSNPATDRDAQVVGWIDFNGDGLWNTSGCGTTANGQVTDLCERSAAQIFVGSQWGDASGATCSQAASPGDPLGGVGGWSTGNVPAGCEGHIVLVWDLSGRTEDDFTRNATYARFRISTDEDRFITANNSGPTPCCLATDGEVEDHKIDENLLPVTVSAFESRWTSEGLEVSWGTSSEMENVGFYIWGFDGSELHLLTPEMIPSRAVDGIEPQDYTTTIIDPLARSMDFLAVAAVDIFGSEEIFGMYAVGEAFGRPAEVDLIDWETIRGEVAETLAMHDLFRGSNGALSGPIVGADFRVTQPGLHRVSYEQMVDSGMDLSGVNPADLAVTRAGEPVPRFIHARAAAGGSRASAAARSPFGPGSYIEFWGEMPDFPDALYVENYAYRVSVDPANARDGQVVGQRVLMGEALTHHLGSFVVNDDNFYSRTARLPDPWIAKRLTTFSEAESSYEMEVFTGERFVSGHPGRVEVEVAGFVAHKVSPAHHVRVYFNGVPVYDAKFNSQTSYSIRAEIAPELIQEGANVIRVTVPGETDVPFDMVDLGSAAFFYPREFSLRDGSLLVQEAQPGARVQISDLPPQTTASVFAWDGRELVELRSRVRAGRALTFQTLDDAGTQYWISAAEGPLTPVFEGAVHAYDLLDDPAEFLIIAHPAFMPVSEFDVHPLNDFVAQRRSDGWSVRVVDITDIQQQFAGGMPLPQAVTRFLAAATERLQSSHVLLVGGDSADYLNRRGDSFSFIPTLYASTLRTFHTPSDGLLADLSGDGVANLAIGRWPVRTLADLDAIVTKTLDWSSNVADLRSAVWVADSNDARHPSFTGKAARMLHQLDLAGWNPAALTNIRIDDIEGPIGNARRQLFDKIESGATFTGFVGHSTPTSWTDQSLLQAGDLNDLQNVGMPTLITTSSCYATYFVSPSLDTVSHRLMNGSGGMANGAVAIHGATVFASLAQNEFMATRSTESMLEGQTLGESIRVARQEAAARGLRDQAINWVLLGDPTLRLNDF